MRKILFIFTIVSLLLVVPAKAQQDTDQSRILIVEIQTASTLSASDEFVEIHNPNLAAIDLEGWKIQYKSANGTAWQTKKELSGMMQGRSRLLIASQSYDSPFTMAGGFAAGGGHVQIVRPSGIPSDVMGWGGANEPETSAAPAPSAGESLKRAIDEDGYFIDNQDNSSDFFLSSNPSPQHDGLMISAEKPGEEDDNSDEPAGNPKAEEDPINTVEYLPLTITELFIDPAKPLTDADDEYVEIFNPNNKTINLEGYTLETGSSFNYSFTIPNLELMPGDYLAVFSIDTGLTLSNSGGQARVLDPAGAVIYETAAYTNAKPGTSWALVSNEWSWSNHPTPGQANIGVADVEQNGLELTDRSKIVAAASQNDTDGETDGVEARTSYAEPELESSAELNKTVLAGVGSMALLYAGYEYRHDIGNRYRQLRGHIETSRQNRKESKWRRRNRIGQRLRRWQDSVRSRIGQGLGKFRLGG